MWVFIYYPFYNSMYTKGGIVLGSSGGNIFPYLLKSYSNLVLYSIANL